MPKNKIIFITATDTGVGKTVAAYVLAVLLRSQGRRVGVLKPIQCAGSDAQFLKKALALDDDIRTINPFYAPEPLSPHLAFRRSGIKFDKRTVKDCLKKLCAAHDVVLVEGAGGLMVPVTDSYNNADLIADLNAEVVVVARLGLGTINHTLLTIEALKRRGIKIRGLIFCERRAAKKGVPESTNPQEIQRLSAVRVLGTIPYLKPLNQANILRRCKDLKLPV
jgi:dethiobiotin synthetase